MERIIMSIKNLTLADFDETISSSKPVLVDFWAPWCGPCRMQDPILEDLAKDVGEKAVFAKVNVDEEQQLAVRYGVSSIPTVLIFQNGSIIQKSIGVRPKDQLRSLLGV